MKKLILFFTLLFITLLLFSQEIKQNLQKGYIAEGYDVVTYFSNRALKGKKEIQTKYNNAIYLFSSKENLNIFLGSPKKYIPQYDGYCAYAVAVNNKKVSINPKSFEIRNGKLYLFYNSWGMNTLNSWLKENPEDLIQKADKNWEKLSLKE